MVARRSCEKSNSVGSRYSKYLSIPLYVPMSLHLEFVLLCRQILNLRLREAELERQRQADLERQRLVEGRERLRNLNTIQEEILQLNQLLVQTGDSPADLTSFSTRGNQLCSQVSEVVRKRSEVSWSSLLPKLICYGS